MFLRQLVAVVATKGHLGLFLSSLPHGAPVPAKHHGDPSGCPVCTAARRAHLTRVPARVLGTLSSSSAYKSPVGVIVPFSPGEKAEPRQVTNSRKVTVSGEGRMCPVMSESTTLDACVSDTLRCRQM